MAVEGLLNVYTVIGGESQPLLATRCSERAQPGPLESTLLQLWREIERHNITRSRDRNGLEKGNCNGTDQSIDLGEKERQKVRQVFQKWSNNGEEVHSMNNSPQTEQVHEGRLVKKSENGELKGNKALRKIHGRQALIDLVLKDQMQRKRELQCLMDARPVSDFAHCNRIQSLLRGRFLHIEKLRPVSVAASELVLLKQRQTVSCLREEFLSRLDTSKEHNVLGRTNHSKSNIGQEVFNVSTVGEVNQHEAAVHSQSNIGQEVAKDMHTKSQRAINISLILENQETVVEVIQPSCLQCNVSIHDEELDASQPSDGTSDASKSSQDVVATEDGECQQPEDDEAFEYQDQNGESNDVHGMYGGVDSWEENTINGVEVNTTDSLAWQGGVYGTELRELRRRTPVSKLLQSGFRESLDLVMQSYVERQGHASFVWEMDGSTSSPNAIDQNQEDDNLDEVNIVDIERTSSDSPSLPLLGPELQDSNMHPCLGTEWEVINELRNHMDRLQQEMNNMERMLETCMDMQIELQHSVQHEVFAALHRDSVSKGVVGTCAHVQSVGKNWSKGILNN